MVKKVVAAGGETDAASPRDSKPTAGRKRKRRYSLCVENMDLETTQKLLGKDAVVVPSTTPEVPGAEAYDRHRRFSVCFDGLEMQDMEKLLQESNAIETTQEKGIEVALDSFDGIEGGEDLGMFLRSPEIASISPEAMKQRARRFSMCLEDGFISQHRPSVTRELATTPVTGPPVVRVIVPAREPPVVRMAVVQPGSLPPGVEPTHKSNASVLYAHKMPRPEPKVVTAMPVSGGPAVVATPVQQPMREISTRPVAVPVGIAKPAMKTINTSAPMR